MHSVLYFLLRSLARWRQPRLAAWLLVAITRPLIKHNEMKSPNARRYRALVMARAGFFEDVGASFRGTNDFDVVCWPSFALKAFAVSILSPSLDHNTYLTTDPKIEATKLAYRDFLAQIWAYFSALKPVDVVLTGNFSYCAEREFAAVLEASGTPFIAIHKENVRPPKRVEYWRYLYKERRGPFLGRKILVYNGIERELQIESGVATPDKIITTGMPRLDRIHHWRRENAGTRRDPQKKQILFFAFARNEKLTAIQRKASAGIPGNMEDMDGDWGKMSWSELGEGSHSAMIELARRRPDIKVIIKTKGQNRKKNDILQMLQSATDAPPPNLEIITGGDPFPLMTESQAVIGFNTTGLLEAVAAGKPVIVPRFGEARKVSMRDHIIDLDTAVTYAHSPDELIELASRHADDPITIPAMLDSRASEILEYWVGNREGAAGRKVHEAILDEIGSKNELK